MKNNFFTDETGMKFNVRRTENFTYTAVFENFAAGATDVRVIQIDNEAIFMPTQLTQFTTLEGALGAQTETTRVIPNALLELTSTDTGHRWQQIPISMGNLIGNGSLPGILPGRRYLAKNSTLEVKIYNIGTDILARLEIALVGIKYYLGSRMG